MGSASTFELEGVAFRGFRQWFLKSSETAHSFYRGFRHAFRATTWLRMRVSGIRLFFSMGSAMGSAHRHANHVGSAMVSANRHANHVCSAMGSTFSPDPTSKSRRFRHGFRTLSRSDMQIMWVPPWVPCANHAFRHRIRTHSMDPTCKSCGFRHGFRTLSRSDMQITWVLPWVP